MPLFHHIYRTVPVIVWGTAACLILTSCAKKKEPPRPRPPVPVSVATAAKKTVPLQVNAIGNVEAYSVVSVKPQISGTIMRVHFSEGQDVKKGDVLFTLDKSPFQAALRQAEAILAKDVAQAKNAEEQAQRYSTLVKDGIVTREQYDAYRTTAEALIATAAADRAAVENARIQLGYCTIRSPLSGRTGNLAINAGNVVKANETALVTINQINPIYVTFGVPEKQLPEIKRRMAGGDLNVAVLVPEREQELENGKVSFLDNTVDPATGMIKLKGTFANKNRLLWPGQFVKAILTLSTLTDAVVVPHQAVLTGQKGQYVFVMKEDKTVEQRPIVSGITFAGINVVESGLKPGETVITDGQMRLIPGAKVEVKQQTGQGGTDAPAQAPSGSGSVQERK